MTGVQTCALPISAAYTVIAECEYIVPVGDIEPENVHTYGMCVNYIVEGDRK